MDSSLEQRLPIKYVQTSVQEGLSSSSSLFDDLNRIVSVDNLLNAENKLHTDDDLENIRKKLDTVEPVCTTVKDSSTTVSPRKSRQKSRPATQTTTCVKELINHGQKYFFEEIKTTNEKGVLIKPSRSYGTVAVATDANKL